MMHASSMENMQECYARFILPGGYLDAERVSLLDLGGAGINGSYRDLFPDPPFQYRSADLTAGPGVDLVLANGDQIPLPDESVDILISGQMLEHCPRFWLTFQEMARVLAPAGLLILIAPSAGPIHRYPVDCYRFYPDAYQALADYAGLHLYQVWRDERGPWQDLVGVFGKRDPDQVPIGDAPLLIGTPAPPCEPASAAEEGVAGAVDSLVVLETIHATLQPRGYLEIGVRHGRSLALASCPAVGVDPAPQLGAALPATTRVVETTSDTFFTQLSKHPSDIPLDLVLIDGMHLFEFALRDFMGAERNATPSSLIVIDDIYPCHPNQARRNRTTRVWTGDVWKLARCLSELRPDLLLIPLDTAPTGLLLVAGIDPRNRVLWDRYNPIVRRFRDTLDEQPPAEVLERRDALDPRAAPVRELLQSLRELRQRGAGRADVAAALATLACPPRSTAHDA